MTSKLSKKINGIIICIFILIIVFWCLFFFFRGDDDSNLNILIIIIEYLIGIICFALYIYCLCSQSDYSALGGCFPFICYFVYPITQNLVTNNYCSVFLSIISEMIFLIVVYIIIRKKSNHIFLKKMKISNNIFFVLASFIYFLSILFKEIENILDRIKVLKETCVLTYALITLLICILEKNSEMNLYD